MILIVIFFSLYNKLADRDINEIEEKFFKQLVDYSAKKLQTSIRSFITLLQVESCFKYLNFIIIVFFKKQNIKPTDGKFKQKQEKTKEKKDYKMNEISSAKVFEFAK